MNSKYFNKYIKYKLKYLSLKDVTLDYDNDKKDKNYKYCNLNKFKINVFDDFISKEECEEIINLARPLLERSEIISDENDISDERTSSGVFLSPNKNAILKKISEKVSEHTKIPVENQENIQVINYQKGQFYDEHYDEHFYNNKKIKDSIRKNTFFVYLNDVEKGGFTGFPNIDKKIIPKSGRAVSWNNILESNGKYYNDPCSLHLGIKPDKGEKWALTIWSHDKKIR